MAALSVEQVQAIVDDFLASFNGNFDVLPVVRYKQEDIYGEKNSAENIGFPILGAFHPATRILTLVAANMDDEETVLRTIRHELFGHYGLNTFTPAQKLDLLKLVIETQQEKTLIPIWDNVKKHYPEKNLLEQAEEVFAFVAEQPATFFSAAWDKVKAQFQKVLRQSGLSKRSLTISELREEARTVANGIKSGERELKTFPASDYAQFRVKEKAMKNKKPYHEIVAEKIIAQLEQGTAPWQIPWRPGNRNALLPMNPVTGKRYKGINTINLLVEASLKGYSDQRWLTYNQASAMGAQVRKGEKGTVIQYWKFSDERPKTDPDTGKPVLDENGKAVKEKVTLATPRMFMATVFNAAQVDNMPTLDVSEQPQVKWDSIERAESILAKSGARIIHQESNRAFYSPGLDSIHIPAKTQFETAANYYATALHELGHWTGHPGRLNRDLSNPFGTEGYAKEELRAEIASMIIGDELGIGHDPGQHAAYVKSWIRVLKEDPLEIFRAAADAEKIHTYLQQLEQTQSIEQVPVVGSSQSLDSVPSRLELKMQQEVPVMTNNALKPVVRQLTADEALFGDESAGDWLVETVDGDIISPSFRRSEEAAANQWAENIHVLASAIFDVKAGVSDIASFNSTLKGVLGDTANFPEPASWNGQIEMKIVPDDDGGENVATLFVGNYDGQLSKIAAYSDYQQMQAAAEKLNLAKIQLGVLESRMSEQLNHPPVQVNQPVKNEVVDGPVNQPQLKKAGTYINVPFAEKEAVKALGGKWDGTRKSWYVPNGLDVKDFAQWPLAKDEKIYLAIPYAERGIAKAAFAKWDSEESAWYADSKTDLMQLRKYINPAHQPQEKRNLTPKESLAEALQQAGAILKDDHPLLDGVGHRLAHKDDKGGKTSIFYAAHESTGRPGDIPAGVIINNKTGEKITWYHVEGGKEISQEERAAAAAQAAQRKADREKETAAQHQARADVLTEFFNLSPDATGNEPYAVNKSISVAGLKVASALTELPKDMPVKVAKNALEAKTLREQYPEAVVFTDGDLLVPAVKNGRIWSIQSIQSNGAKMFAKGSTKMACSTPLNGAAQKKQSPTLIAVGEGYSTLRSVEKVTFGLNEDIQFECAFNAGNLKSVVERLRAENPDTPIIVFGDDDHHLTLRDTPLPNQGKKLALAVAEEIDGVTVCLPKFAPGELESGLTDFNDIELKSSLGFEGLSVQVRAAIQQAQANKKSVKNNRKLDELAYQQGGTDYRNSRGTSRTY